MMSDKDLIRRGEVEDILCNAYDGTIDEGALAYLISELKKIPAVPQEMSARELLLVEARMIYADEYAYAEYSRFVWNLKLDDAAAYAERWAREHPERSEE